MGLPQMIQSRAQFGLRGAIVPFIAVIFVYIGFNVFNPALVGRIRALEVVWHKRLRRGYGWIFPCPDGVFNIGVGLVQ